MKVIYFLVLVTIFQCKSENLENKEKGGDHVWTESSSLVDKEQDPSVTLLLKDEENPQNIHNNPLDNLSDLREIHQFDIDLSNYTDHEAVESEHKAELDVDEFVNHFNILPGMDTRDFNDSDFYSSEFLEEPTNDLQSLSPELYEIVTSTPEENESKTYDDKHLDNDHFFKDEHDGMDGKYYTLLENIKKFHPEKTDDSQNNSIEESEIHDEDNDVMHPLISLTQIKPNSMRLAITPKKYSKDAMVRLMYKRVPRNKPALMEHLDDPIIEYIQLYRLDQEHFLTNLPMGKYIVCADYKVLDVVVQHNCFETIVNRPDTNVLQGGVVAIIALAILTLVSCLGYAIYHQCLKMKEPEDEETMSTK